MKFQLHLFLLPALIVGLNLMPAGRVIAQTFTTLHIFADGDGANPYAGLLLSGNTLYGTAVGGGSVSSGTVFKVNTDGTNFMNLSDFTGSSEGHPNGRLILSGNTLYGTAFGFDAGDGGAVFKVNTDGTDFATLHNFTARFGDPYANSDGADPIASLILSGDTLYGTAQRGGVSGYGTVFKINTDGSNFTNLHSFTASSDDGAHPWAGLILSGNTLYGATAEGGSDGNGTVFAMKTDGTGFTNLHSFNYSDDGGSPRASLIRSGNTLYGTATFGGSSGYGTVFAIHTDGTGFTNLHSFAAPSGSYPDFINRDGVNPYASLVLSGNTLYGTASGGGSSGKGTVFEINIDGTGFRTLYSFTPIAGPEPSTNSDGATPYAGLILSGNTLYGTASEGGSSGRGTVFSLSLAPQLTIRYVNVNSANPVSPFTNWTTAATTIQDAVDAAVAGDQILVTNGVYQTGGRVVFGALANRVVVDKPVTVQSVNGAAVTVIRGFQLPGAIRCAYLTNGAALAGFTLTDGATRSWGENVSEDDQKGAGAWCASTNEVVSNCVFSGNRAVFGGGGASGGTLDHCVFTGNSANSGGGAYGCALNNCILAHNSTESFRNGSGGGVEGCLLNNCTLAANSAVWFGGGAAYSTLNNCTLNGNSAGYGGGVAASALNNCMVTGNSASAGGGVAGVSTLNNCIVYYNSAPFGGNYFNEQNDVVFNHSCTTPLPSYGVGNISAEPQLADLSHLSVGSPCRGAGSAAYAIGLDIDGEAWANPPSIGCDEYHPGVVTGPLSVSIQAAYLNVAVGFAVNFTAAMEGHATANRWEFGDGTVVNNQLYPSHSWTVAGEYTVVFQAYNDTNPGGTTATIKVQVAAQPVHYVALGSANPVAPYTSWATAANVIQDAVDAATVVGALVLVTNGVYQTGEREASHANGGPGTIPNRVTVIKAIMVRSVNGAAVTVIDGQNAVRCVYLASDAALEGFTLTKGLGGVWCERGGAVVSNCVLTGNSGSEGGGANGVTLHNCTLSGNSADGAGGGAASCTLYNCTLTANSASFGAGGGVEGCTLYNCTLTGNSAINNYGGGAAYSTLNNCTLRGNSAGDSGGADGGTLNNCTITDNSATNSGGGVAHSTLNNCILFNNTHQGVCEDGCDFTLGNMRDGNNWFGNPRFVDYAGGDLRLQSNSPCINAGSNASAPAGPDLDGNPRIVGGTVDIGAYEFQSPQSLISYAWLQQYGLLTDGSADVTDTDGDGLNNWQEWRAGTNPTNALSVLRLLSTAPGVPGVIVSWQSVSGINYFLDRVTQLGAQPSLLPLATDIVGQPGTTTFTDTNAVGAGPFFYRVGVQE